MMIALASGSEGWLQRVRVRWPNAQTRSYREEQGGEHQILIVQDNLNLICACTAEVSGHLGAGLYLHDARYPGELVQGGACSGIEWGPEGVVAFRDLFGFSPMWYVIAPSGEGLAIASHPRMLKSLCGASHRVNTDRLAGFLVGKDSADRQDFFEGLWRLRPGERLRWQHGALRISQTNLRAEPSEEGDMGVWAERLSAALIAGHRRMKSEGMIALSGGLDSGLVAATWLEANPGERLQAVSLISERWGDVDERPALDQWVRHAPINNHRWCLDRDGPLDDMAMFARHADLGPQGHGGIVSMARMLTFAGREVGRGVLLTGIGGDQMLTCLDEEWLLAALWGGLYGALAERYQEDGLWALYQGLTRPWLQTGWVGAARQMLGQLYTKSNIQRGWGDVRRWLTPEALHAASTLPSTDEGRYAWRQGWVWEDATRHALLCTLESGVRFAHPLLDPEVVEVLRRVPPALFMHPEPKALARAALRGRMPEAVRRLPKTGSFCSLIEENIAAHATTTLQDYFSNSRLAALGLLNEREFLIVIKQFSEWVRNPQASRVGVLPLWRTISAELWLRSLAAA